MSFLIDTDVCSAFIKGQPNVVNRFFQYGGRLHTSVVTVGELYAGARRAKSSPRLLPAITGMLNDLIILDVTFEVAATFGAIRAQLLNHGLHAPDMDALIASTAIHHGLTFVTHNTEEKFDMIHSVDRRSFLYGASVAGFGIFANGRHGWAGGVGPNETLNFACIGVGGKGKSDTQHVAHFGKVVAVCDVDDKRAAENLAKFQGARRYTDYRQLLDEQGSKIDAVVVSAPDHHHAPAAVTAMRMGKHVYCQKPLTHSVWEARLMRETAREKGVCTQMGNQGTAEPGFRRGAEVIRAGAIGEIREVHVWTNRPFKYWKQAPDIVARPTETPGIPSSLHWFEFLGPAPDRAYHPVYHPHNWRGWWDFGTGSLGDMACHTANLAFMALKLGLPIRVSAQSGEINQETYPAWATITYEFPARGSLPPVKLIWHEGAKNGKRNLPAADLFPSGFQPSDSGSLFLGSKGKMYSPSDYGSEQLLFPRAQFKGYQYPEPTLPRIKGGDHGDLNHKQEWVEAIRAGKPSHALSNFEYASTLTESMLLGNVAVRSGEAIDYDPAAGHITNSSTASQYLKPHFRKGWEI